MHKRHILMTAAAIGALGGAGCKVQPVDDNRDPRVYDSIEQLDSGAEETERESDFQGRKPLSPAARVAAKFLPLGHAGDEESTPGLEPGDVYEDEVTVTDRWRIGFPAWERGSQTDAPWDKGAWWEPYHQNVLKGDYPIPGTQNTFLLLEGFSLTRYEARKVPTPSGVFPRRGGNGSFFGQGNQSLLEENIFLTMDLFQGETSFKPVDWRIFLRGGFNWNNARARENQALFADPARGTDRTDRHASLQQAFFETTIASISDKYDLIQARVGTQLFNSDFKSFLFFDEALGARVFGTWDSQRWSWNAGLFRRWDKDTNSALNTFDSIKQDVVVLNLYRQDILEMLLPRWKSEKWTRGLTAQVSYHHFQDDDSVHYDENEFLVRPRAVGTPVPNDRGIDYWGWTMDGHVKRLNITSALYHAEGYESFDEIAGSRQDVSATMAALELSVDVDWMRFRAFGYWQEGDDDPFDGNAHGFDAIYDNPVFAGGEFGFWNRNSVRLTGSGVGLNQRFSLNNSLRSSKDQGAPSFVNPGLIMGGVGYDAQLTPHIKLITNASYLRFDHMDTINFVLNQESLGSEIGYDLSVGVFWRPGLTENVIVKGGVSALVPGAGFRDIYGAETLYAMFAEVLLTW